MRASAVGIDVTTARFPTRGRRQRLDTLLGHADGTRVRQDGEPAPGNAAPP